MAISFVQITAGNFTTNTASPFAVSFSSTITAGSIILVVGQFQNAVTFSSLIDDKGDAVTDSGVGIDNNTTNGSMSFCKAFFAATTGAKTVTLAWTGGNIGFGELVLYEIAGLTSAQFDKASVVHVTGTTSPATNATGTLSSANEALVAYEVTNGVCSAVPGAPWSHGQGSTTGTNTGDGVIANTTDGACHQVVSATTSQTATFTETATGDAESMWIVSVMSGGANNPVGTGMIWV